MNETVAGYRGIRIHDSRSATRPKATIRNRDRRRMSSPPPYSLDMNTTGYRVTYTLLGLALVAIIAGSILFIPSGNPETLPDAVETYAPRDGDIVVNPIRVLIDLQSNYEALFVIDGISIPQDQVDSIFETGRYQFTPGEGKVIERWTPGSHTVVASWIGGPGSVDKGTLVWTFEVQ